MHRPHGLMARLHSASIPTLASAKYKNKVAKTRSLVATAAATNSPWLCPALIALLGGPP